MRYVLILIMLGFASCKKCMECSSYVVTYESPDGYPATETSREYLFRNQKICGDDLERFLASPITKTETRGPGRTYTTVKVRTCR